MAGVGGVLALLIPVSIAVWVQDQPVRLQGFKGILSKPGVVELDVSVGLYRFRVVSMASQDPSLEREIGQWLKRTRDAPAGYSDYAGKLHVRLDDEHYNQPNLILLDRCLFYGLCWYTGYLELLRQSEERLQELWSFHKPGGYTVLGRSSLTLPNSTRVVHGTVPVSRPLDQTLPEFGPPHARVDLPAQVNTAIGIVEYMWSRAPRLGPHNDQTPQSLGPVAQLDLLESGAWSTQCGNFQNIFVNLAAASPQVSGVRYVSLLQYYPSFPDLIPHSHAVAEVLTKGHKWVLIDPWFGLLFEYKGRLLSASEITKMSPSDRQRITVRHVLDQRPSPFDLEHYQGSYPSYGYWGYFGTIIRGPNETPFFRVSPGPDVSSS